jgi:THO complex subunit 1
LNKGQTDGFSYELKLFCSSELTRLWNLCPDNLQASKGVNRNFLPSLESYLGNRKEKADPSFEWRALRLLARQSPHFFTLFNSCC